MSIRQFIADVMELPKAINAVNKTIGGEGMSHTPWQLQRTPYESEIDIVSDGRVIATVEAGEDKEEIAQMIVSAPDMLEALGAVHQASLDGDAYQWVHTLGLVRDTIQKARGEE